MINVLMATYHRDKLLKETLSCLDAQIDRGEDIHIFIFDNASDTSVIHLLNNFKCKHKDLVTMHLNKRNIGKSKALNSFIRDINAKDVVCSFDSDLIIERTIERDNISGMFFTEGANLVTNGPKGGKIPSIVVPDQTGNGQHLVRKEWKNTGLKIEEHIESNFGLNIAGGCLFVKGNTFKNIGGYRENRGMFGGDDGYLLLDVSKHEKAPVHLYKNLVVFHPFDENDAYKDWKRTALVHQLMHQRCLFYKGFFDK
jgi:glycosyltransferase involved in cell wall biosynthesis